MANQVKFLTLDGLKHFKQKLLEKISLDFEKLNEKFFNKVTGDTISGPVQLTENINYGKVKPTNPKNGEIFFEEFNGNFPIDISAPNVSASSISANSITENGQNISNKYALKSEIPTLPAAALPLTGGTVNGNIVTKGLLAAYMYSKNTNHAALTMDKAGAQAFGIGGNGQSMTIQYGQVDGVLSGNWSSSQDIIHDFKGTIKNNTEQVPYIKTITTSTSAPSGLKKGELYIIVE